MKKKILVAAVTLLFLFACSGLFADEPVFTGPLVKLINSGEITAVSVFYGNYSPFFTRGKQVENIKTIKMLDDKVIIITNETDLSFTLPLSSVRAYGYDAKANRLILYM